MLASFCIMSALIQNHVLSPNQIYISRWHLCTENNKSMHFSTLHRTEGREKTELRYFPHFIHISKPYMMVFFDPRSCFTADCKKEPKPVKAYQIENKISMISFWNCLPAALHLKNTYLLRKHERANANLKFPLALQTLRLIYRYKI